MKLESHELHAIQLIFRESDPVSAEVRDRVAGAAVLQREYTGVGFFSTIRLPRPVQTMPEVRIREFNFSHPAFPYGGSFMCMFESADSLEIEAVAFGGAEWPKEMDMSAFSELI